MNNRMVWSGGVTLKNDRVITLSIPAWKRIWLLVYETTHHTVATVSMAREDEKMMMSTSVAATTTYDISGDRECPCAYN
eukprot:scaffold63471_cov32-Attheya_sp.AAC.1